MLDSSGDIALTEKIELLEKALIRERNAKKFLEQKLDSKDQIQLTDNMEFISSFEKTTSRQVQLQFLSTLTEDLLSQKSLDELLSQYTHNMSQLLDDCQAFLIHLNIHNESKISHLNLSNNEWELLRWRDSYKATADELLKSAESIWHRIEHEKKDDDDSLMSFFHNETLFYLVLNLSTTEKRLVMLDISHFCYSEDFKQTINTAAQQFTLAVKRRVTELELARKNKVLSNTIIELKSTQEQLVHSEKMGSLGQLAAGVAHEINNPIGYISSNLNVLKDYINTYNQALDQLPEPSINALDNSEDLSYAREDVDELLSSCIEGVQRVTDIVASLKTFSRKGQDEFTDININDVIESALKIVWNKLKYDHEIVRELADNLPNIQGNHGQLQQVFVNLFVNAAHAMKRAGLLTIQSVYLDNYVEVKVHDTGCGMDASVIRHLFEPFYTTKDESEGTGLGLSVSYAIVEKHNAMISVNSEPNKGSTFTLRFQGITELDGISQA